VALVADAGSALAWAIGGERVKPIDDRRAAPALLDQAAWGVTAGAAALGALDQDHGELADEVAERGAGGAGYRRSVTRVLVGASGRQVNVRSGLGPIPPLQHDPFEPGLQMSLLGRVLISPRPLCLPIATEVRTSIHVGDGPQPS